MSVRAEGVDLLRLIRLYIYGQFLEHARPPTVEQTAEALHTTMPAVRAAFRVLARGRVLVLEQGSYDIRMAMPFSAVETPFEVRAINQSWYANCAWDALGIPAMLSCDARIVASCGDCGDPITLAVMDNEVVGHTEVIHFAVPAARWWKNIVFT